MTNTTSDLNEVARANPVPAQTVVGERASSRASALRDQILRSSPQELSVERSRRSWRRLAIALAVIAIIGAGTAVASRLFSERDVERFLPQGSTVFIGTQPRCHAIEPSIAYSCRLAHTPTMMSVTGPEGRPAFKGAKFGTVDDDNRVNGGCIALNDEGTDWACYLGERAVAEGVLTEGVLGQEQADPGAG